MTVTQIDLTWQDQAACKGTPIDWWFPDGEDQYQQRDRPGRPAGSVSLVHPLASQRCASCTVALECRAHALAHEPLGVWAGTSSSDRHRLRRQAGIKVNAIEVPIVIHPATAPDDWDGLDAEADEEEFERWP